MQQNILDNDAIENVCEEKEKVTAENLGLMKEGYPTRETQETKFIISSRKYELLKLVQEETNKLDGSRSI